jgi:integrase
MAISKRRYPSGREVFRVRIFANGRCVESSEFERLRDAKAFEADRRAKLSRCDWIEPSRGRVPFDQLAQDWLASRSGVATRTQETEAWHYKRWVAPTFGRLPVASITTADVSRWLGDMANRGAAPSTVRRSLAVLRGVFAHAVADRRIAVSPGLGARAPRSGARREGRALGARELQRLLDALPSDFVLPVACLALSGLRFSEWAALTVGDVITTPHGAAFRIHRAMPQSRTTNRIVVGDTKGHRSRTVPIPSAVFDGLAPRLATANTSAPLFPTPTGLHWTNTNFRARCGWMAAVDRAGLHGLRIHDLRHTAATLLLGNGADLKSVSRILGHASTVMTADLYGHVIDSHVFEASAKLPDLSLTRDVED